MTILLRWRSGTAVIPCLRHRSPPDGRLPLGDLLQALARDGYRGAVTVECHPDALDAEDEESCLAALRRAQRFCRTHYNRR